MRVVGVIPIKLNSVRTPGKNIKPLSDGTPLMHLVQRYLLDIPEIEKVYVYCSNEKVKDYMLDGVELIKRDPKYDGADADVADMMKVFANVVDADIYVQAHATVPFIKTISIQQGIQAVTAMGYDSAVAVRTIQDFLWKDGRPYNYSPKNIPRTQDMDPFYSECGLYIFKKEVIQNLGRKIGNNPFLINISEIEAIDIDTPEDFMIADAVYTFLSNKKGCHIDEER